MSDMHSSSPIGILMLDTRFPRIPGDIGNPATWPFPVVFHTVRDASAERVVRQRAEGLLDTFIAGARMLEKSGACGITTSCGFLAPMQRELAAAVNVPVLTSSLFQAPLIEHLLPVGKRVGILTIAASSLDETILEAAGLAHDTPVGTTEGGGEFTRAILNDEPDLDVDAARDDNIEAARALVNAHRDIGAIVLECTNMAPYAADIVTATGLPVHSIVSFVSWFRAGIVPPAFNTHGALPQDRDDTGDD